MKPSPLHLLGDVDHLVERRRDQPRQADHVDAPARLAVCRIFSHGHHHAEVDHLVIVAAEHDADDVLADVVDVALDGGHQDLAARLAAAARRALAFSASMNGQQVGDGLLHDAGTLDHLRQEHLAGAEEIADDVHAVHERPFDDRQRRGRTSGGPPRRPASMKSAMPLIRACLSRSSTRASRQARAWRGVLLALLLDRLGELGEPVGGVGPAVEQHVLDVLEQVLRDFLVDLELAGIDDAHVEPGVDRVVEERGVHRLAHRVVAAETRTRRC